MNCQNDQCDPEILELIGSERKPGKVAFKVTLSSCVDEPIVCFVCESCLKSTLTHYDVEWKHREVERIGADR